jgi:uncharacterized protein (DUF2249 family)
MSAASFRASATPLIFGSFDALSAGEALLLVNDHDPKPLFYQFQAESKGEFTWDYLETGPDVWQVRIGKPAADKTAASSRRLRLRALNSRRHG